MGNSVASKVSVSIKLEEVEGLEWNVVQAGSTVRGTVYVSVKDEIPVEGFVLKVKGKEESEVRYFESETYYDSEGNPQTRQVERWAKSDKKIFKTEVPLTANSGWMAGSTLTEGRYEYPFEFELPESVPASMKCKSEDGECEVEYKMSVEMLTSSGDEKKAKQKHEFKVVSSPRRNLEKVPALKEPKSEKVNFCCCINKGMMMVGLNVVDTQVEKGQEISFQTGCVNESTVEIVDILAKVKEKVKWSADHYEAEKGSTLIEESVLHRCGDFASLAKSDGDGDRHAHFQQILQEITGEKDIVTFPIPSRARDTYSGKLIKVKHELEIVVMTGSCITNPDFDVDLRVVMPHIALTEQEIVVPPMVTENAVPPDDWADAIQAPVATPTAPPVYGDYTSPGFTMEYSPSVDSLLQELGSSIDDLKIIQDHTGDSSWKDVFDSLSPVDFGGIVARVDLDHNQPTIAALVADTMENFTSDYCIEAMRNCTEWNRTNMVSKLLPYISDLSENKDAILANMTEWEQISTEYDFKKALGEPALS